MNRFAALIDQLALAADDNARRRLLADYLSCSPESDRAAAAAVLVSARQWRRVSLSFIRGIAEARIDPALFALSLAHVGDPVETIALLWPARPGANKDPSLADVIEGLSSLGRSELPKRLETWLDAANANGRWALIKLATGTLRADVKPEIVAAACAQAGLTVDQAPSDRRRPTQDEMFAATPRAPIAGTIAAALMYAERVNPRINDSPLRVTFGLWSADVLTPVGKLDLLGGEVLDDIERYVAANTTARFGPVREVVRTRAQSLVLDVAFDDIEPAPRRKAGLVLVNPRIARVLHEAPPDSVASLDTLAGKLQPA